MENVEDSAKENTSGLVSENEKDDTTESMKPQREMKKQAKTALTDAHSEIDLRIQAQEHMYRHTLNKEKTKVSLHALEEVGRSLTAISQRRRQYFLDYKTCDSIRQIRQWFAWETKRNLDTNNNNEAKAENAATRGLKIFLNKVEFYGTLLKRFEEYLIALLVEHYSVSHEENFEVSKTKDKMMLYQEECETLLSDSHVVVLENANHTEIELKFPIISILPRAHEIICQMTDLATLWRIHARYAQLFENVIFRRSQLESIRELDEKKETLRNMESHIRLTNYDISEIEKQLEERERAMLSKEFSEVYTKCIERIDELTDLAEERKIELRSLDTTIKYLHERTETFKKLVAHKRKEKLEINIRKREEKMVELNQILNEVSRLEEHKGNLDLKEEMWLRGGYEEELGIMQDMKNKINKLKKSVTDMEEERNSLKSSYHDTREQIMALDAEHETLTHEYEYVKRLSTTMLPALWNTSAFAELPCNAVKPGRISIQTLKLEDAYVMTQPKGVAMIVSNDVPLLVTARKSNIHEQTTPLPRTSPRITPPVPPTPTRIPTTVNGFNVLFSQLGFYVIQRHQLSNESLRHNLAGLSDQYHGFASNLNSLLVVVFSTSDEWGRPVGADGSREPMSINEYLKHFTHSRCPSLMDKPKIFLFLMRVTEHEPHLPVVGLATEAKQKKKISSSSSPNLSTSTDYFQPEPLNVSEFGDDMLVVRVMHQNDGGAEAVPTFGGTTAPNVDKLDWHVKIILGSLLEQASYKDVLSILAYVKEEIVLHAKSAENTSNKAENNEDIIEVFVDHSLKKKLYIVPGI